MDNIKKVIKRTPGLRALILLIMKARILSAYVAPPIRNSLLWLMQSREYSNFTYDLQQLNKKYLASLISTITSRPYQEILAYFVELECNQGLRDHLAQLSQSMPELYFMNRGIHYGRRIGWYAFVRALKPRVVVETGVDKGLGGCVLAAALMENAKEGYPGHYFGTDINPSAGILLSGPYKGYGDILYGDSIRSLKMLDQKIDIFINDSDHSGEYEYAEYQAISLKLDPNALILGDNSHDTDKLLTFAQETGREFIHFAEKPKDHWYPGAGIGIAFHTKA